MYGDKIPKRRRTDPKMSAIKLRDSEDSSDEEEIVEVQSDMDEDEFE